MNKVPYYDEKGKVSFKLPKTKSRKILYEQFSKDDGYYDDHFMEEYIPRSFESLSIIQTLPYFIEVSFQFSLLCLHLTTFFYIKFSEMKPSSTALILISGSLAFCVSFLSSSLLNVFNLENNINFLKELVIVIISTYVLSPLYLAIMKNNADDSMAILVLLSLFCYLLFYDYKSLLNAKNKEEIFKDILGREELTEGFVSLVTLFLNMIMLCSRFDTHVESFSFQIITYAIFLKFQTVRKVVYARYRKLYYLIYFGLLLFTLGATFKMNIYLLFSFLTGQLMILFLIPVFLKSLYKENKLIVGGPWEIADFERFTIDKLKTYKFEAY